MADVQLTFIQDLPATTTPLDNDLMLINHSGSDQSITAQKLSDYFNDKLPLSSAINSTSETTAATSKAVNDALASLGSAAKSNIGTGANQVPDMSSFSLLSSAVGYQKLPSGLIIQWISTDGAASTGVVSLPISFPQAILIAMVTDRIEVAGTLTALSLAWHRPASTLSTIAWSASANPGAINILAIGY